MVSVGWTECQNGIKKMEMQGFKAQCFSKQKKRSSNECAQMRGVGGERIFIEKPMLHEQKDLKSVTGNPRQGTISLQENYTYDQMNLWEMLEKLHEKMDLWNEDCIIWGHY